MSRYLLLFTFGPIQGFISQARKTADLYAGSQILTKLAKAVTEGVSAPHQVLSPSTEYDESLTNRILIEIAGTEETVGELGESLEQKVKESWLTLARDLLKDEDFREPAVQQQLKNHLETYWLAVPLGDDYGVAYTALNTYAAADKNQRTWSGGQNEAETGRKCALDGVRNALFYGSGTVGNRVVPSAIKINDGDKSLQPNEALSAVSYVKRRYGQTHPFPSTATIALLHILEGRGLKMALSQIEDNDQLYYKENHTANYLKKIGEDPGKLGEVNQQWTTWRTAVSDAGLNPTPYYALLHFDGDDMGKWFSGAQLPDKKKLPDFHREFTKALGMFAQQAADYLNRDHRDRGRTVYAGGDDFVGFLNLNSLFEVLYDLRAKFDSVVFKPLEKMFSLTQPITFSAGVAIAHYKQPLGMVLDEARRMEKEAKKWPGKDAYGIGLIVRSGSTDEVVLPWTYEHTDARTYTAAGIENFVDHIGKEKLSSTFITSLELAERHYGGWPEKPEYTSFLTDYRNYHFGRSVAPGFRKSSDFNAAVVNRLLGSLPKHAAQQNLLNIIEFLGRHVTTLEQTP